MIYGKSGSGKSRSLKNFQHDEILLVNVEGKPLPFRGKFDYTLKTDNVDTIIKKLQAMPCKVGVIDDAGYLMTHRFMNEHRDKSGNKSFDMYDNIADTMYNLVERIKSEVPDDKTVYIMMHEDTDDFGNTKLRTIGRLIDNKVCLEGMVTIVIRCVNDNGKHYFIVHGGGGDITKTPEDMFPDDSLDNDLVAVDCVIREYWGLPYCNGQPAEVSTNA